MHLSNCEHPKTIKNPYTGEVMVVPCGRCNTCINKKASQWIQRLDQESRCWKYTAFFTLTYDQDHMPLLKIADKFLYDNSPIHQAPDKDTIFIDLNKDVELTEKDEEYLSRVPYLGHLSVYDIQCFMKRLRINLHRKVGKNEKIRYYICGEYGETTLRPHYHGLLFFSSEQTAEKIGMLICESWKFGNTHFKFIERGSNARYVTKYVNCTSNLPSFYRYVGIRPFAVCSRRPPIGTLIHDSEAVKEMFYSASPEFVVYDTNSNSFRNVPLWRTFKDRLFPQIPRFGVLSHFDRVALYRIAENQAFENYHEFYYFITNAMFKRDWLNRHFFTITDGYKNMSAAQRTYAMSCQVVEQSRVWNIDVDFYVRKIEQFYDTVEKLKLHNQLQFESQFVDDYDVKSLIGVDRLFLQQMLDVDISECKVKDLSLLISFGIDPDKWFSFDPAEQMAYRESILPDNSLEFLRMVEQSRIIFDNSCKTKRKNDYLASHPEAQCLIF